MKDETILALVAILALLVYGLAAMYKGLDSMITVGVVSGIAGIAGYEIKAWRTSKETPQPL